MDELDLVQHHQVQHCQDVVKRGLHSVVALCIFILSFLNSFFSCHNSILILTLIQNRCFYFQKENLKVGL